jgi:hypothetical protein
MKKTQHIIHVEFRNGSNFYFGSIAAIYELFDANTIKVSAQRLYGFDIEPGKRYENSVCIIRKEPLRRKPPRK